MSCCVTKNYYSPQKKWILLLHTAEIRRKTQVRQPYCNLYAYGANNPVRYIDPTGRSAWDDTVSWTPNLEENFREKFIKNTEKLVKDAQSKNQTIDCADVALTAFVNTAAEMGLSVTFEVYNSENKKYESFSSNDATFTNKEQFLSYVKTNMGAINLLDWKTTKSITNPKAGDLAMFDLRFHNDPSYQGHTIVILSDPKNNIVRTAQGHLLGTPAIENYRLGDELGMGATPDYRRFNYEKILK